MDVSNAQKVLAVKCYETLHVKALEWYALGCFHSFVRSALHCSLSLQGFSFTGAQALNYILQHRKLKMISGNVLGQF